MRKKFRKRDIGEGKSIFCREKGGGIAFIGKRKIEKIFLFLYGYLIQIKFKII